MPAPEFKSFEEFWPYYVSEHSKPETRTLHAIGTTAGMACALALIAKGKWKLLPLALLPGYGAAWVSHFLIEKNKPATFDYPLWSFMGDYKMLSLMVSGKMDAELKRIANCRLPIADC
ncbi:MAG: Mpo1-like protein, partial [Pyrinomonadaceae bacterium]